MLYTSRHTLRAECLFVALGESMDSLHCMEYLVTYGYSSLPLCGERRQWLVRSLASRQSCVLFLMASCTSSRLAPDFCVGSLGCDRSRPWRLLPVASEQVSKQAVSRAKTVLIVRVMRSALSLFFLIDQMREYASWLFLGERGLVFRMILY